jgi:hypothetical protein
MSAEDRRKQFEQQLDTLTTTLQVGLRVTNAVPRDIALELAEWAYQLGIEKESE